ncbi:hypothetical protein [Desulfoscipio gibsoniae]|nr:hypothetical protein [Desulfoscipio gibsoniae]
MELLHPPLELLELENELELLELDELKFLDKISSPPAHIVSGGG